MAGLKHTRGNACSRRKDDALGPGGRTARRRAPGARADCKIAVMLDRRAQYLLKTLVEHYVAEGQPVGSRVLYKQSGLELSPATIRNVMADLEDLGYIASPHTSAGRIPTPK